MEEISALILYGAVLDEELSEGPSRSQLSPEQVPMEQLLAAVDRQVEIEAGAIREYLAALDLYWQAWLVMRAAAMAHRRAKDEKSHLLENTAEREQVHAGGEAKRALARVKELETVKDDAGFTPQQRIERIARPTETQGRPDQSPDFRTIRGLTLPRVGGLEDHRISSA